MSLALTDETGNSIAFDQLVKHKENIQPLKQGRSVAQLHQILDIAENKQIGLSVCTEDSPDPSKSITGTTQQRNIKRRLEDSHEHYQTLLTMYKDNDILAVWCDYIEEIQTSSYSSSTRALVLPVIESMINFICLDPELIEQYKDDQRFMKQCYLLCESVTDPLRIYRFLQGKGIGQKEARFFLNYSTVLYINQHYRSTIEVLYNALKARVEPMTHLKNRYKYIVECEKQRLSKILGSPVDDKRFQELVKAKDQQTIGKFYSFSYDSQRDNILADGSNTNGNGDDGYNGNGVNLQRGLSVVYKEGHGPQNCENGTNLAKNVKNSSQNSSQNAKKKDSVNAGGIYQDSDDEDGDNHQTDQKAIQLMSPDIKRHSRLATMLGKSRENQQPYTSDFSLAYDTEFLQDLDEHNKIKGIVAQPIGSTTFELPVTHITTGIYCDEEDDE